MFSGNIQFKLFHKLQVREKTISYFTDLRWLFTVTKDSSEKYLTSASSSLTSSCRQGRMSDSTTLHGEVEGGRRGRGKGRGRGREKGEGEGVGEGEEEERKGRGCGR